MSFNKIIAIGNLGRDPELRYTPNGDPVCSFSIATTEKRKDKAGEPQEITTWFRCTLWGKRAEAASQYLTKGQAVYVEGRLREQDWTDRDGKARHTLEVNATDMQFIGGPKDEHDQRPNKPDNLDQRRTGPATAPPDLDSDDEPPF